MTVFSQNDVAGWYESLVNWPQRLAREAPFYRQWFARAAARRVLDVACGTGHHAALFHSWGMEVVGADLSAAMLARARAQFGDLPGLDWFCRDFTAEGAFCRPFDVVVCVGNSLALAADSQAAQRAVREMMRAAEPGGLIVVHVANLWRLPDGPCIWQKCVPLDGPAGRGMVLKGLHRHGQTGYVDLVVSRGEPPAVVFSESVRWLGLEAEELTRWFESAGGTVLGLFGGYAGESFERHTSVDLIVVAQSGSAGPSQP